jgi:hypothetical protein
MTFQSVNPDRLSLRHLANVVNQHADAGNALERWIAAHDATGPAPVEPTVMQDMAPQKYTGGTANLQYKRIVCPDSATNFGKATEALDMVEFIADHCELFGWNYGTYFTGRTLRLLHSILRGTGGGDDYPLRAYPEYYFANDCTFENIDTGSTDGDKAAWRVPSCKAGTSQRCTHKGRRVMYGGGGGSEWDNPLEFCNFTSEDDRFINTPTIEIYNRTHDCTWKRAYYENVSHISIQPGAFNLTFENCPTLPTVRLYDGNGQWTPMTSSGVPQRGITIQG